MTEDERKMIADIYDFLYKPPITGGKTRAEQLDDVLVGVRYGRTTSRIMLWIAGMLAALAMVADPVREVLRAWLGK